MLDILVRSFERDEPYGGNTCRGESDDASYARDGVNELCKRCAEGLHHLMLVWCCRIAAKGEGDGRGIACGTSCSGG